MMETLQTLPEIEAAVWAELQRAVNGQNHLWRTAVLATRDGDGADARVVVLRELDRDERSLRFFTDARSPKCKQIEAWPGAKLVLWSRSLGWQLRIPVQLSIETSGLAVTSRWAKLKMSPAAQDYLSPLPPGAEIQEQGAVPMPERESRDSFALVTAQLGSIDWLELRVQGQRRARFDADGTARWLQP
ncbi:MAG TPA: pyridoxamine 5'-phosphate oxidase family protein [Burkholderiaceae bacterium]|nr:pyridoxamine 5'-phosphate oxidase family protein [Burkholderiaceae bacterium]